MTETLRQYAELTREAMAEAIAGGEPADYLYDLVRDYTSRRGKGLRPGLLLAAADACGAATRTALPAAAALELLHTAFLIHDDVEDHSRLRRGRPTLHELHGVALAVNAGDALANLAVRPLTSTAFPRYRSREVLAELRLAIRQTTEGQALELGWRRHAVVDLTPLDYLELVGRKTCWYTTMAPLRIGAQLGRWRPDPAALDRLGFLAGCAFQIRDDLLDLAPGGQAGKTPRSDVLEGKRTLVLIHLLSVAAPTERAWVVDYLQRDPDDRSAADQDQLLALMVAAGSLTYAERFAAALADAAQESLETAFADVPPSPAVDFLRELIDYLVSRTD
jgi:geranylgeranyl diphosphate synthase, type II